MSEHSEFGRQSVSVGEVLRDGILSGRGGELSGEYRGAVSHVELGPLRMACSNCAKL